MHSVPAKTASTKTESSSTVHFELVAMYSAELLAKRGRNMVRETQGCTPVLCQSLYSIGKNLDAS